MSSFGITPKNFNDLTGQKFGRLTVIKRVSPIGQKVRWLCRCDCGNLKDIAAFELTSGNTKSCGCLQDEARHRRRNPDGRGTRLYGVWKSMRQRCRDKNHSSYARYGGRGICVCEEWEDYQTFHDWAFANGYDPEAPRGKCTIDRIDPDGNYEPENCRWVDSHTQNANRNPFERHGRKPRAVIRVDEAGNETQFDSIRDASRAIGAPIDNANISACCKGNRKTAYGYEWRFV